MSALSVLQAARERIATPERWTQGKYARGVAGSETGWASPTATCWCSLGALRASSPSNFDDALQADDFLAEAIGNAEIADWNDDPARTHAEVLAAFTLAIELARKEGAQ